MTMTKIERTAAAVVAFLIMITLFVPPAAMAQSQEQKVFTLGDIAEKQPTMPAWVNSAHEYARHSTVLSATCNDQLVATPTLESPPIQATISLTAGCDILAGTWVAEQVGENIPTAWLIAHDLPAGSVIQLKPPSALTRGGDTFAVSIIPLGTPARQTRVLFDTPEQFQAAFEKLSTRPSAVNSPNANTGSPFTVTKDLAFTDQTVAPGTTNALIGAYLVTVTGPTSADLALVAILSSITPNVKNLRLVVDGTSYSATQTTALANVINAFTVVSSARFTFAPNVTFSVKVYADIPTETSGTFSPATVFTGIGSYNSAGQIVGTPVGINGQTLTISNTPPPATTLYINGTTPPFVVGLGTTEAVLCDFYASNPGAQDIIIANITVVDTTTSTVGFQNLQLWQNTSIVGIGDAVQNATAGYQNTVHLNPPLIVKAGTAIPYVLTGDVAGTATFISTHTFSVVAVQAITPNGQAVKLDASRLFSGPVIVVWPWPWWWWSFRFFR